jgi:hypothetical protein
MTPTGGGLAKSWDRFWFAEIPPHIFAVLRILFGLLGCISLAGLFDLPLFWTCDGLVASRDSSLCLVLAPRGLGWLPGYAVCGFAAISFIAMAIGFRTRLAVICAFGAVFLMAKWNDLPMSAAHQVLRAILFCLVWADCGRVLSIDAWLRSREPSNEVDLGPLPIWPLRLIQVQVALIYFVTALWKLNNVLWRDGSALHYVFENPQFRRFAALGSPGLDPWTTLATYATLGWELAFAFLVLHRRTRRWALISGTAMHLGMWGLLELGPFSWLMLASYVAFLDPHRLRDLITERASYSWTGGSDPLRSSPV